MTYDFGVQPRIVHTVHDCMVEIIGIALILVLEVVEKIKECKREGR